MPLYINFRMFIETQKKRFYVIDINNRQLLMNGRQFHKKKEQKEIPSRMFICKIQILRRKQNL